MVMSDDTRHQTEPEHAEEVSVQGPNPQLIRYIRAGKTGGYREPIKKLLDEERTFPGTDFP
jgi:hypothetical protein